MGMGGVYGSDHLVMTYPYIHSLHTPNSSILRPWLTTPHVQLPFIRPAKP
ncbi:uncharacterized protein FFE2_09682 [Fusarium fujikuroi]|nr:uncharacterized protein FFE2_09682 [Fusarium fujikuroi]